MGPREAALAVELLGVEHVIPIHYGTFPILAGTPDALRAALAGAGSATSRSTRRSRAGRSYKRWCAAAPHSAVAPRHFAIAPERSAAETPP